jgi:hypothetical protein
MKKLLFFFALCLITSCNTTVQEPLADVPAGYLSTADGKSDAFDGDPANLDIIDKYLEAHNNKDLEAIFNIEADSTKQFGQFFVYGPRGEYLKGRETHKEFLSPWFEAANPNWNTYFSYSMKVDGQVGEWVINGHVLTQNVEGEEVKSYDVADFYIEDGKVGGFWVYTRAAVQPEE